MSSQLFAVQGITKDGDLVWYSGKAGAEFVCKQFADAFKGYNKAGAQRKADELNRMTALHGVRFIRHGAE
jgi:hypothetical protein